MSFYIYQLLQQPILPNTLILISKLFQLKAINYQPSASL